MAYWDFHPWLESLRFSLISGPDYTFYCNTDFSLITARKAYGNPEQLKKVNQRYQEITKGRNTIYEIDTRRSVEETINAIMKILQHKINRSLI